MTTVARRARWGRVDLVWVDVVFALLLAIDMVAEATFAHGVSSRGRLATQLFALPLAVPIATRRQWPEWSLAACGAVAFVQQLFHGQLFTTLPSESAIFGPILCGYGVGAWSELRRGLVAVAVAGLFMAGFAAVGYVQHAPGSGAWTAAVGSVAFFLIAPWLTGRFMRERSRRQQAFAELERQTVAEVEQRELAAIAEERALIGRELQDIIAHSVSVMVVQAGGARRLLGDQPERARESILTVEQTGREALAEMRRLLGVLRRDDDPRALAPQPGLAQLGELVEQLADRGLECELREAAPVELTPGIDLVAYRVIEAALVAVIDHGGGRARVSVRLAARDLDLEVTAAQVPEPVGEDLRSVGERVALYDGQLEVVEHAMKVLVSCRLPLGAAVSA